MTKKSLIVILGAVWSLSAICPAGARAGGAQTVEMTCLKYAQETVCYPAVWKEAYPNMFTVGKRLGQEKYYFNQQLADNGGSYYGVLAPIIDAPKKGWAEVSLDNLSEDPTKKNAWYSDPISGLFNTGLSRCDDGNPKYPCYRPLGKKKVNEFEAFYYLMEGGPKPWVKIMYVYLVRSPRIYLFQYMAHTSEFEKYQRYFYTMLSNFRLNKK